MTSSLCRPRISAALAPAVASLLVLGCDGPQLTEILVVTDTDLDVPAELGRLRFRVVTPEGEEKVAVTDLAAGDSRPAVLALVHRGGALGPIEIDVLGERTPGEVVIDRGATVSFVQGEVLVLPLHVLAACVGVACGEGETCVQGECRGRAVDPAGLERWNGMPPRVPQADAGLGCLLDTDCDDGLGCTVDSCGDGVCAHAPDDARCASDGIACTIEACDPERGCVPRVEHALCDDGVSCTIDRCDAGAGCVSTPSDQLCDDGIGCTMDACDPTLGCSATPDDSACDDGLACTADRCDAALDCVHAPDDARCDDGVACTFDVCDASSGCTSFSTEASCSYGERCDRSANACVPGATFTEVYAYFTRECAGGCHVGTRDGGLDLSTRLAAYAGLVDVSAVCGGGSNVRVIPFDARRSLLWRKVARTDLCGSRMPPSGSPASSSDAALIESWIAAGAPDN